MAMPIDGDNKDYNFWLQAYRDYSGYSDQPKSVAISTMTNIFKQN